MPPTCGWQLHKNIMIKPRMDKCVQEIGVQCEEHVWNGVICMEYNFLCDTVWTRSFALDFGGTDTFEFRLGQIWSVPFCRSVIIPSWVWST